MKSNLTKYERYLLALILQFIFIVPALGQTDTVEKQQPKMKFSFLKSNDDSKNLNCEVSVRIEKNRYFIKDLPISFFFKGDSLVKLGVVNTDNKGVATLKIDENLKLPFDKEGFKSFRAVFDGNKAFESAEEELKVKDIKLEIVLTEDSLKSVTVNASENLNGTEAAVEGPTVVLYVKRSLGLLKIKDQQLTGGTASFDFPLDIPGDTEGNLTIITRIEDDENYGTVEKAIVKKWGIPLKIETNVKSRELWSPDAPLWMSVTLFILILAVVIHYLIIFYKLYQIKKEGKD